MIPQVAWGLSIVVSIDLDVIFFIGSNDKTSRGVVVEERVVLLIAH